MLHDEQTLLSFQDELHKLGAPLLPAALTSQLAKMPGRLGNAALSAGSMGGIGAGAGAAIGAGISGVRGYREAKAEGADTRGALAHGALSGLRGAGTGAALGGAAGLLGGGALAAARPEMAEKLRARLTESSRLSRFGQRQVHAFTGATPAQGVGALRMDVSPRAQALGLTSIPGTLKSVRDRGLISTGREAFMGQLHGAGAFGKTMAVAGAGLPLAMSVKRQEGETGKEHALRAAGNVGRAASGLLLGNVPFAAQQVLEQGVSAGARGLRRGVIPEGAQ